MKRSSHLLLILSLAVLFFTTSHAQDVDIDSLRASDVNADGVVNILDLVLVAQHFGETPAEKQDPNPDVNADGTVNILDLVLVAQHFGKSIDPEPQPLPDPPITPVKPTEGVTLIDIIHDVNTGGKRYLNQTVTVTGYVVWEADNKKSIAIYPTNNIIDAFAAGAYFIVSHVENPGLLDSYKTGSEYTFTVTIAHISEPEEMGYPYAILGLLVIDPEPQPPPAVLIVATPPNNSHIAPHARISLIFDNAPADVVASSGTATVVSKKTVRVTGPFTLSPPALTITWGDGTQTLSYTIVGKDTDPPKVTGGTISDGETVDSEVINIDGRIEITFSEKVTGNIRIETEDGYDVGWIQTVKGTQGTLKRVRGKELGHATRYVITGKVWDSAGNALEVSIDFITASYIPPPTPNTPPENLIDHWRLDEATGNIATNAIKTHDGEILGAKWTNGVVLELGSLVVVGNALEFDGVGDAVVVKDYPTFDLTENMTFTAWFQPTGPLTNRAFIVKHDAFYVSFGEQQQLKFGVQPNDISVESTDNIRRKWYHVAGAFDGKTLRIYIDAQLNGELPHAVPMTSTEADLVIGQGFSGRIDDVRIYNKALSQDEIVTAATDADYFYDEETQE